MATDITDEFTILISEPQRRVISQALVEFIQRHVGSSEISGDELEEALELSDAFTRENYLAPVGLNNLVPRF